MPTDPFVAPDPADRPRQQQNLPPGIATPPATHWRADRPGDLGPRQPRGALFGSPGPNVGYAYTLAHRAADRLQLGAHEHLDDAIAVVAEIAGKRATLFGRAPVMGDVEVAMALLGYDGNADDEFIETRGLLVQEAAHDYWGRRMLVDAVPERILRLPAPELGMQIDEWRALHARSLLRASWNRPRPRPSSVTKRQA